MTARVFVPLVGADGAGQQVFEALAGPNAPETHPARLTPQISELYDFGLYRIGQTVREAVTRFCDARRDKVWLGRANAKVGAWYLRISDLQVGRLSDENARSAGLGLTLAALLQSFDRKRNVVFATGEIQLPQTPGQVGAVAVAPVDGIRGKLSLVGDYIQQHRAQLAGSAITVVLPKLAVDGRPLEEVEARTVGRVRDAATAVGLPISFLFIDRLDELETALGPFAAEPIVNVRAASIGGAVLAALAAVASLYIWIVSSPVALAWRQVEDGGGLAAEPQRAIYRAETDRLELLPTCYDEQRQPVVVGGETLVLRVTATDERPFAGVLAPARYFIASVSREADPIILDASLFRTAGAAVEPGSLEDAVAAIPIEATEDEIRLFVVATRDQTVSLSQLTDDLRAQIEGLSGAAVLTTSTQFLNDRFDGQIDYQFKVTTDATHCPR
ncbi:MAG TPA: hypothetical protein VMP03_00625 [Methylomirabilota bacterium]|nr:hypothetical protein [Methylomirabilota bacterium]